jgi:hypothetical protein
MPIPGNLMTTAMAVMPHTDVDRAIDAALTLDIPFWPQLPHLSYYRDGENHWDRRKAVVGEFLKQLRMDFIGFQEVNHFQADFLENMLTDYDYIGRYNRNLPWWQSNMIFFHKDWTCLGTVTISSAVFPTSRPRWPDPGGRHIDWILYRGNIRPGTPRVITFHKDAQYPSDHFPVAADFTWDQGFDLTRPRIQGILISTVNL